jgi:hypothetical protein
MLVHGHEAHLMLVRPINTNEKLGEGFVLFKEGIAVAPEELLVLLIHLNSSQVGPVPRRLE